MSPSRYPDWESFEFPAGADPAGAPVAFCADLSPASVLAAYQRGIVPMPAPDEFFRGLSEIRYEDQVAEGAIAVVGDGDPYLAAWWSPDPRPVIGAGGVHLGRNVRKRLRRDGLVTTANAAFHRVAEGCREGREPRWLTDPLLDSLIELHDAGWAHSIEVWRGDELAGGAMCVGVSGVLSGDSLFSRHPGAGAVAVADMRARLTAAGGTLVDAQWDSPFLRLLGAQDMPRERYLAALAGPGQGGPVPLAGEPLPALRLLGLHPVRQGHAEQAEAGAQHAEHRGAQGQP
jgi:leucyl/phenylalanyl-tRNA--protein transferase